MKRTSFLFTLTAGYGLGDHVQMTAAVRHLRRARPDWDIDFCGDAQKSDCMLGLCRAVYAHGQEPPDASYDRVADVDLYDTLAGWRDRPNTRVSAVLHEKFGMDWVRELGRYQIESNQDDVRYPMSVYFHWNGISAAIRKNLSMAQAECIDKKIHDMGLNHFRIDSPSAQITHAAIRGCRAFVGIDSGPSKVAAATDTPALVCWTGNHPALYFDPAPNVTHLVPARHEENDMLAKSGPEARENALAFFRENYDFRFYQSPEDLPVAVGRWLDEVLP